MSVSKPEVIIDFEKSGMKYTENSKEINIAYSGLIIIEEYSNYYKVTCIKGSNGHETDYGSVPRNSYYKKGTSISLMDSNYKQINYISVGNGSSDYETTFYIYK